MNSGTLIFWNSLSYGQWSSGWYLFWRISHSVESFRIPILYPNADSGNVTSNNRFYARRHWTIDVNVSSKIVWHSPGKIRGTQRLNTFITWRVHNDVMSNINEYITHLENIWQYTKQVSNSKLSVIHTVNPVSIVHLSILNTKFGCSD